MRERPLRAPRQPTVQLGQAPEYFSFEPDGKTVSYFSRNRPQPKDEPFVGKTPSKETMMSYEPFLLEAFRIRSSQAPGVPSVVVYAEYFG